MQLLHLLETAELLDSGQSIIAVMKIYLEQLELTSAALKA